MPITYNGYEFSDRATISCQLTPEYDGTGQLVVAHVYTLTIVDFVFPGQNPSGSGSSSCSTNKTDVDQVTNRLMIASKELLIPDDIGLGSSRFIQGGGPLASDYIHDVNGGPHPQSCEIKNIGAGLVSQITYVIKFAENPCGSGIQYIPNTPDTSDVKAFNWTNTFSISNSGFTTRTTQGYVEIQNIMVDDGNEFTPAREAYLVDQLRGYVTQKFLPIDNFERNFNWQMTPDHKRLNFSIVDKEIESPNSYPADVIAISMPTSISFKWPTADNSKSQINIRMRIKLSQLAPRVRAWEIFDSLLETRLGGFIAGGNKGFLILSLAVDEDYFSNEYSFQVSATATSSIYDQMGQLNLFATLPSDWDAWAGSLFIERGGLGLQGIYAGTEDGTPPDQGKQARLCADGPTGDFSNEGIYPTPPPKFVYAACSDIPSPGESWVNTDYNVVEAPRLNVLEAQEYRPVLTRVQVEPSESPTSDDTTMLKVEGTPKNCISESPPSNRWQYTGYTQRVFYKIPPPVLEEIAGVPVKLVGDPKFRTRYLGKMFCLPVYEAEWAQEYVAKDPTGAPNSDFTNPTPAGQPSGDAEGGQL